MPRNNQNLIKRQRLSTKTRLSLFLNHQGTCQSCQSKIHPGQRWELDHIIPLALGGEDKTENLQLLCRICHAYKTKIQDLSIIAKVKRQQIKHLGAKKQQLTHTLPCGKASPWKKKLNGQVVSRNKI